MTDRELLELAAKAAYGDFGGQMVSGGWNPLEDDGEALRLAVKLRIWIHVVDRVKCTKVRFRNLWTYKAWDGDDTAATRMAIVLAAAEIGAE